MRLGGTPDGVDTNEPPDGTSDETLRSAFFALDVTDPDPNQVSVLWEISNDSFGYTTSNPIPVKVGNTWYLVFGSGPKTRAGEGNPAAGGGDGYTDTDGHIFVVNPSNGVISRTINVGVLGEHNFFGPPVGIDYDLDYSVDMIYIGDAKGNLWRIKTFTGSGSSKSYAAPSSWAIDVGGNVTALNPQPLFSLGTDQPILIKPLRNWMTLILLSPWANRWRTLPLPSSLPSSTKMTSYSTAIPFMTAFNS
jgi:Tfp pilus tip-associated adhesin PilY1